MTTKAAADTIIRTLEKEISNTPAAKLVEGIDHVLDGHFLTAGHNEPYYNNYVEGKFKNCLSVLEEINKKVQIPETLDVFHLYWQQCKTQ